MLRFYGVIVLRKRQSEVSPERSEGRRSGDPTLPNDSGEVRPKNVFW